ncbi:MAG: YkgJ family cysteine cluster protein [Chitinophagaceae bacterium]|nr:YkgJ family cysteine cluster protein [Chitinophagaceae bacterium]
MDEIAKIADEKQNENDSFRAFLKSKPGDTVDHLVHTINEAITPQIDCTQCGRCCSILMINITEKETIDLSDHLQVPVEAFKEKYVEVSQMGQMVMNKMPCAFLGGKSCTIYEQRFTECREFPHLHKPNFTGRLFGTLMHYAMCPIIFNVVEELKLQSGFGQAISYKDEAHLEACS